MSFLPKQCSNFWEWGKRYVVSLMIENQRGGRVEDDKEIIYLNSWYNLKLQTDIWQLGITMWEGTWNLAFIDTLNYKAWKKNIQAQQRFLTSYAKTIS